MTDYISADAGQVDVIGTEADRPGPCEYVIFHGSPNPDSSNFGPDEYCEEDGDHDGFCEAHWVWMAETP